MSLQIWLPLNGNLNNQGLTNISITNNGTTINNNGKIGKAIEFGANKYIKLDNYASTFLTYNTWSLSLWFKCTAQNTSHTGSALISGGNWNQAANLLILALGNFSSNKYTTLFVSGSGGWNKGYNYNFLLNQWYHVTLTSGNGKMRAYVNGQLIGDSYNAFKPTTLEQTWICIGNGTYSQSFHFYGLMNDIRIYDHCLSPKEVEELSKGLILHYKLNNNGMGQENLIPNSSSVWTAVNSKANFSQVAASTSNFGLADGDTYIFSIEVKIPTEIKKARARVQFYNSSSDRTGPIGTTFVTNGEGRIYVTGTILSGYAQMQLAIDWNASSDITTTNVVCYYRNIKLEKGNKMTIWSPALSDVNYPNNFKTTIYDCSGYGNNGTIVGSLTAAAGSPRYEIATQFPGSAYSKCTSPSTEGQTISVWAKWNSIPSGQSIIYVDYKSKTGLGLISTGILCSSCGLNSYTFSKATIVANTWYHFVIVCPNGSANATRQLYINGVEQTATSSTSNWTYTIDELQVGKRSTTSDGFNGQLSDFRIYATAFTADQVKELYDTSMSVDASGNMYIRELVE